MQSWLEGLFGTNNNRKRDSSLAGGLGGSPAGSAALQQGFRALESSLSAACTGCNPNLTLGTFVIEDRCVQRAWLSQAQAGILQVTESVQPANEGLERKARQQYHICHQQLEILMLELYCCRQPELPLAGKAPLQLLLGPSLQGAADLQLQLFTLLAGTHGPAALPSMLQLQGRERGMPI